ncbi:MAG: GGDEF domain-containing protein [Gammaproteobacteria bacterium]
MVRAVEFRSAIEQGVNSLYADEMRKGFKALRFHDLLEEEFREVYLRENIQRSRLVIVLSLIVVIIVTLMNIYSSNAPSPAMGMDQFGLTIMAPFLVLTLLISYTEMRSTYQFLIAVSALVIGVCGTVIDVQASLAGMGYYFAGQIGWIFMVWCLLGLMFSSAAVLAATISIIYLAWALFAGLLMDEIIFEAFMLANVNLLGGYSCYKIEYATRHTFLESRILSQLADRDGLTGLYNRRAFNQYMERVWRQSRRENMPLTVMLLDIDHFKAYNDMYGHQAGDDALKNTAEIIASAVQRPLDMAARYGGEEFALVMYGPARHYGRDLPERLRREVLGTSTVHEGATHTKFLTVSIGVAIIFPDASRSMAGAIQMADEALYQAKEAGRNQVVVRESGNSAVETGRFQVKRAG